MIFNKTRPVLFAFHLCKYALFHTYFANVQLGPRAFQKSVSLDERQFFSRSIACAVSKGVTMALAFSGLQQIKEILVTLHMEVVLNNSC